MGSAQPDELKIMVALPWIQVAGVHDLEEAQLIVKANVGYLGLPLRLPVHQEDISETDAKNLVKTINPSIKPVLITYLNKAKEINDLLKELDINIVQLHGEISQKELAKLKQLYPDLWIIKSLIVGKHSLLELKNTIESLSEHIDMFITDTFDPETGACGATGRLHDWSVSKELVKVSPKPVILAGGLTPENVYEAIIFVKPAGVDVHTGVEDGNGRKDFKKLILFVKEVIKAYQKLEYITA